MIPTKEAVWKIFLSSMERALQQYSDADLAARIGRPPQLEQLMDEVDESPGRLLERNSTMAYLALLKATSDAMHAVIQEYDSQREQQIGGVPRKQGPL